MNVEGKKGGGEGRDGKRRGWKGREERTGCVEAQGWRGEGSGSIMGRKRQ